MARRRFRKYWSDLSQAPGREPGRPPIGEKIRDLIRTMATANPLWRAPRIHGELLKLGIEVSERTVSRILRTLKRPPSQTWKTFLQNHVGELVSIDFFTVPTVSLRVLYVFLVLDHTRRKVCNSGLRITPPPHGLDSRSWNLLTRLNRLVGGGREDQAGGTDAADQSNSGFGCSITLILFAMIAPVFLVKGPAHPQGHTGPVSGLMVPGTS
jgi:hypothetical protein